MKMAVLVINARGGLANRMRSIASAISLAQDTGATLRMLWQPNDEMAAKFDQLFEPIEGMPNVEAISNLCYRLSYEVPRKRNIYLSAIFQRVAFSKTYGMAIESENPWYENNQALKDTLKSAKGNVLITSGLEFYDTSRVDYNSIFRPTAAVREIIDQITEKFDANTYGMHIRRTDNILSIENSPTSVFEEYIRHTVNQNSGARFYVATDDYSVKNALKAEFGSYVITSDGPLTRTTVEGTVVALAELYALASTRKLVGSYWSSFSEMAARIGGIKLDVLTKLQRGQDIL